MALKRSLFLSILALGLLLVSVFLVLQKTGGTILQKAAAVDSQHEEELTQNSDTAEADVVFSDGAVENLSSKEIPHEQAGATSSITIESEPERNPRKTELVIEKTVDGTHSVSYKFDTNTLATDIHSLSNEARAKENLPPLSFDTKLAKLAIDRSTEMAQHHFLSHNTLDGCDLECRFKSSEFTTTAWGENLGEYEPYNTSSAEELAKEFVALWLKSSEHRRNLVSSEYTHEGIGIATSGNRLVVTVIFAKQ